MTRQKKELLKKIHQIEEDIATNEFFSCGCAPNDAYEGQYREINALEEELARLRHYDSLDAMRYDTRGYGPAPMELMM